ncbi:class I SAM-dependent methyltransferase [Halalkalicoccus sp. NIPERK01]|uniref:class I SAM-dependent methyltransferase n=1 Tax=Halalkalicoccus sp. NIPERK01 TaxID=3053469 RepID=UPI00256EB085|nr:class I SAM-dependent methyltransferase [Halalkalicoccus sp. NIPERK01]MDL5363433.1 class I SAM-dependent methyltransferase [Halalkalicoccus sp. NIPERK01]
MEALGGLRERMKTLNERLESAVGMDGGGRGDCLREYRARVAARSFERALHLGAGRDTYRVGERASATGGRVVALDTNRSTLAEHGVRDRVVGCGGRLPFADDSFDLVFSEYVFEHLEDPARALAEIDRVLRPGGEVVLLVPNPAHYYATVAALTPFWFHVFYLTLQGESEVRRDHYPTYYRWGRYEDLWDVEGWTVESIDTYTGPTAYTRWLPVHVLFVALEYVLSKDVRNHLLYLAHYSVDGSQVEEDESKELADQ